MRLVTLETVASLIYIHTVDFFDMEEDVRSGHAAAVHTDNGLFELIAHA